MRCIDLLDCDRAEQVLGLVKTAAVLVAGAYDLSALPNNAQWLRRKFTILEDQELKIDLMLRPATRRYLTFPFPVPVNWQGVKRADYVITAATGEVILEGSMDSDESGESEPGSVLSPHVRIISRGLS